MRALAARIATRLGRRDLAALRLQIRARRALRHVTTTAKATR